MIYRVPLKIIRNFTPPKNPVTGDMDFTRIGNIS
jgi:hypothetical protein